MAPTRDHHLPTDGAEEVRDEGDCGEQCELKNSELLPEQDVLGCEPSAVGRDCTENGCEAGEQVELVRIMATTTG